MKNGLSNELSFTVPLVPPSVNHYKKLGRNGGKTFVTPEALAYKAAVAIYAAGRSVEAKYHEVWLTIFRGSRQKGDVDNYSKVPLDGLRDAGVIRHPAKQGSSDDWITDLHLRKRRDRDNPRSEFRIKGHATPPE
jgi:Holliday junction resolvase RusA-like endonuclease